MEKDMTLEELRIRAGETGLKISDAELERLLPALRRSRAQAAQLRELISDGVEPAPVFAVVRRAGD
ncbi:MAG: hypothetical protein ACREQW_09465 [Candidatus Binatia bacterium]